MTIVEFITVRLDEDAAIARAATPGPWEWIETGPPQSTQALVGADRRQMVVPSRTPDVYPSVMDAQFMERNHPKRILDTIAVKRAIIDLHKPAEHPLNGKFDNLTGRNTELGLVCEECSGMDDPYIDQKPYPCATVRLIASADADHPDYQQEWKPSLLG